MASSLASLYGSESDKVNCSFYLKIGACRHGERCSRKHIKPNYSQTIVIQNMYQNPAHGLDSAAVGANQEALNKQFDEFYEDVFCEMVKYGNMLEMHVCDNVGDHLIGNVYCRYEWEDEAQGAVDALSSKWFAGRPLFAELSPVTDFREACCRQNDMGECNRGGFCNFMHLRKPSASLVKELHAQQRVQRRLYPTERDKERALELGISLPAVNGSSKEPAAGERRPRDDEEEGRRQRRREA